MSDKVGTTNENDEGKTMTNSNAYRNAEAIVNSLDAEVIADVNRIANTFYHAKTEQSDDLRAAIGTAVAHDGATLGYIVRLAAQA